MPPDAPIESDVPFSLTTPSTNQVGKDKISRVFLIENHDEALPIWRTLSGANRVLVHVDAHHDMWWYKDKASVTIANFVSLAAAENLLGEIYWVIPDHSWDSVENRRQVLHHLRMIRKSFPGQKSEVRIEHHRFSTTILGKPFVICSLGSLVLPEAEVLLDIDVDFMLFPRVTYGEYETHERLPWCWPDELVRRLGERSVRTDLVTIAYSVDGGYTPLCWKYLGDELAARLQDSGGKAALDGFAELKTATLAENSGDSVQAEGAFRSAMGLLPLSAAPSWRLAQLLMARGQATLAREMYRQASVFDPSYSGPFESEGFWHFWNRDFAAAERCFNGVLAFDPENPYALLGESWLALEAKDWGGAESFARRAIESKAVLVDAHRALGDALAYQGRAREAIESYVEAQKATLRGQRDITQNIAALVQGKPRIGGRHFRGYASLGKLYSQCGLIDEAINSYRMVLASRNRPVVQWRLALLYVRKGDWRKAVTHAAQASKFVVGLARTCSTKSRNLVTGAYEFWAVRRG